MGLAKDGELVAIREDNEQKHAECTNTFIDDVCQEASIKLSSIDAVAVGGGPGSYTGLRIGVSTAKGICFALDKPLIAIPSLRTIANGIRKSMGENTGLLVPMIDARRNEVYAAVYNHSLEEQQSMTSVILDDEGYASLGQTQLTAGGDGAEKVLNPDVNLIRGLNTSVKWMAELAEQEYQSEHFADTAYYAPVYGKAANAIKPKPLFGNQ